MCFVHKPVGASGGHGTGKSRRSGSAAVPQAVLIRSGLILFALTHVQPQYSPSVTRAFDAVEESQKTHHHSWERPQPSSRDTNSSNILITWSRELILKTHECRSFETVQRSYFLVMCSSFRQKPSMGEGFRVWGRGGVGGVDF